MGIDDLQTLQDALGARWPGVDFRVAMYDCSTRLAIACQLPDGARVAITTPPTMDWRALSMPEWLHRTGDALASRLK